MHGSLIPRPYSQLFNARAGGFSTCNVEKPRACARPADQPKAKKLSSSNSNVHTIGPEKNPVLFVIPAHQGEWKAAVVSK